MQQKTWSYLLVIGASIVWGIIAYRIYDAISVDNEGNTISQKENWIQEKTDVIPDTFRLYKNYSDPFGIINAVKPKMNLNTSIKVAEFNSKENDAMIEKYKQDFQIQKEKSDLKYKGSIINKATNKVTALINYRNKPYLLSIGDSVMKIKLVDIFKDSCIFLISNKKVSILND